jgi:hypothetical protein
MMFMAGVQMLCLGILGEYVGRIYTESKQRPLFLVRELLRTPAGVARAEIAADADVVEVSR